MSTKTTTSLGRLNTYGLPASANASNAEGQVVGQSYTSTYAADRPVSGGDMRTRKRETCRHI